MVVVMMVVGNRLTGYVAEVRYIGETISVTAITKIIHNEKLCEQRLNFWYLLRVIIGTSEDDKLTLWMWFLVEASQEL